MRTRSVRERVQAVLRLDDVPWRIAASLATGVFISCTPFYGLQTLLSILVATVCRLNRAVTVMGAWLNLPWFAPIVYGAALWIGGLFLPDERGLDAAEVRALLAAPVFSWAAIVELLRGVSGALLIGTTVVGAVAGLATYVVALGAVRRRRDRGMMGS